MGGEGNTHVIDDKYVNYLSRKTWNGGPIAPSGPGPRQYRGFTITLQTQHIR